MRRHFRGMPTPDDFELQSEPLRRLKENEILLKPEFWSVDPYARVYPRAFGYKLPITMLGSQVGDISSILIGASNKTFLCMEDNYPNAIKNQRGASKIPLVGSILRSKAPSRGLWMPELVLYGIRELA